MKRLMMLMLVALAVPGNSFRSNFRWQCQHDVHTDRLQS